MPPTPTSSSPPYFDRACVCAAAGPSRPSASATAVTRASTRRVRLTVNLPQQRSGERADYALTQPTELGGLVSLLPPSSVCPRLCRRDGREKDAASAPWRAPGPR